MNTLSFRPLLKRFFFFVSLAALVGLTSSCSHHPAPPIQEGVHLILPPETLQPTTTFEIRFDAPVISHHQVGLVAAASPLQFSPQLAGHFTWLSTRSGVFTPAEPTTLGTIYRVSLASSFQPTPAPATPPRLVYEFAAPDFAVDGTSPQPSTSTNATSQPSVQVLFNETIPLAEAQSHLVFRDASGHTIAATVRAATADDYFPSNQAASGFIDPWSSRFVATSTAAKIGPIRNRVIAEPSTPLPIGTGWTLVVQHGLHAENSHFSLAADFVLPLGNVTPFTVTAITPHNGLDDGKTLTLHFSKSLSPNLTEDQVAKWVSIQPLPPHLVPSLGGDSIIFKGDFRLDTRYEVTVHEGLTAAEAFTLEKPSTTTVTFTPLPKRIYFSGFNTEQLSFGRRQYALLAINVPSVNVRAQLIPADEVIPTLEAYNHYLNPPGEHRRELEPYDKVDENIIRGREVWNQEFACDQPTDTSTPIPLSWDTILGTKQPGVVFLTAERPESAALLGTQTLVQVTDLGLIWKRDRDNFFLCAFSYRTGLPLPGVTVGVYTHKNDPLGHCVTDAQGTARLAAPDNAAWIRLQLHGDVHAVDVSARSDGLPVYQLNIPVDWNSNSLDDRKVLLFSERPVYRPGETFHLKGFVRDWKNGGLTLPSVLQGHLKILDSRGTLLHEEDLTLSHAGSFEYSFALPMGNLGSYRAEVTFPQEFPQDYPTYTHEFQVEEYAPNAFEIKLSAASDYAANQPVEIPVSATYYMGKTLSKARLRWSIQANDAGFAPDGFDAFRFCMDSSYADDLQHQSSSLALQGDVALSTTGTATLTPDIPVNPKAPQPRSVSLLSEITDLDQQTVSERADFTRHASEFYLGMYKPEGVLREGTSFPVTLIAVGTDGTPLPHTITTNVHLTRIEWHTVRVQGAGGSITYRSEPELHPAGELPASTIPVVREGQQWIPDPAAHVPGLNLPQSGLYQLEAETTDPNGKPVITSYIFNVAGKDETTWDYRNPAQIDLIPDRTSYAPGETASILVKTPISGKALVTVEREKVLRSFVTDIGGNAFPLHIPLVSTDAPNVFVSVMLLRGSSASPKTIKEPEYRYGYCQINVQKPSSKLGVTITPDATDYQPGQPVDVGVKVINNEGQPVSGAEITLYAVDEGILSLMGYTAPDPLTYFYVARPLVVRSNLTLPSLQPEDPDKVGFENKGYLIGGGGDDTGTIRKNFPACAFWNATLRSDRDGRVHANFSAPDSLTRFRIIAVASSGVEKFGTAESAFAVNKPLMLTPALPRFANVGDVLIARAVVHNQSKRDGTFEVSVQLDGTVKMADASALTRSLSLAAGESGAVEFPLEFHETGAAHWIWKARSTDKTDGPVLTDAVETALNVGYPMPLRREIHLERVIAATTDLFKPVDPQLLEGNGTAEVTVANTRLLEISGAVEQLLHYPYGCVEQTTSSMLPWLVLQDLAAAIPAVHRPQAEVDAAVNRGINRLLNMQTASGGLSYWPGGSEPMLWGSAYGGMALALAKSRGYAVPEESLNQLTSYLSGELRNLSDLHDNDELSDRCLAVYALALAGRAEPSYQEILFTKRDHLSAESRAMLALAVAASNGPAETITELLNPKNPLPSQEDVWFGSPARELAVRLLAACRSTAALPTTNSLVEELLQERKNGDWHDTQGNAWAVLAMADYVSRVEGLPQPSNGSLARAGVVQNFMLNSDNPSFTSTFPMSASSAGEPLVLGNPLQRPIYTTTVVTARPPVSAQPRQDRGYLLQRTYDLIHDDGTMEPLKEAHVGDRIRVTLRLEIHDPAHYLAIDDPLPAVFEAVNPVFKSQDTRAAENTDDDWFSDFQELREDRALFFRDHINPGTYTIQYLARVRAAGKALAPAAKVEEMYHPERFGLSAAEWITTLPLP